MNRTEDFPRTKMLFVAAVVLLLASTLLLTGYYPPQHPSLGSDGRLILGADGKALLTRDWQAYYRLNAVSFVLLAASAGVFGWWFLRLARGRREW